MFEIIYYADDGSMGDCTEEECNDYRAFALEQLQEEYPEYDVTVSDQPSMSVIYTDDEENRDEILIFCGEIWDRFDG